MNKLYVVKFMYKDTDYVMACKNFWHRNEAREAMINAEKHGWNFTAIESNDNHIIWIGR